MTTKFTQLEVEIITDRPEECIVECSCDFYEDYLIKMYGDMCYNISYLSTTAGTLTGINKKNFQILRKREKEIENIREELQDIKSERIKIV